MKTFGIVGRKNSGKTQLLVRLVHEFRRRGLSVSTIKHTHHRDVELDTPGKDSFLHREAGAREVIVASDHRWFLVHAEDGGAPASVADLVGRLAPCDVVLVEGYKARGSHPRIEVFRRKADSGLGPLAADDPGILAIACPPDAAPPDWPSTAARLELDDTTAIADFILAH
jgi:molybdopterin-guanine dinucleotide biosynthesis protein MobB